MDSILHPLVFLNISDHYTRANINNTITPNNTLGGCLMGTRTGSKTEIFTSFELKIEDNKVDSGLLLEREEQIRTCYKEYSLLGWYFVAKQPTDATLAIHKSLCDITKRELLCLMFDQEQTREEKQFTLYQVINDEFHPLSYATESLDAERVAIEAITHNYTDTDQKPAVLFHQHIDSLKSVLQILREHLGVIRKFLVQEKEKIGKPGETPNFEILRQVGGIIKSVPTSFDMGKEIIQTPPPSSSSCSSFTSPILSQLSDSSMSQAFLSEYTESAVIIALARLYPLLSSFKKDTADYQRFEEKRMRMRQTMDDHPPMHSFFDGFSFFRSTRRGRSFNRHGPSFNRFPNFFF